MNHPHVDSGKRIVAALVDIAIVFLLVQLLILVLGIFPFLGRFVAIMIGAGLIAMRDALPIGDLRGASPGKRWLGLRAVSHRGPVCRPSESAKRNILLALPWLLWALSSLMPGFFAILALVCLGPLCGLCYGMELYKVITDPNGLRVGDLLAGTRVVVDTPATD